MKAKPAYIGILLFYLSYCFCHGESIIYIDAFHKDSVEEKMLEIACDFYGFDLECIVLQNYKNASEIDILNNIDSCAIVISAPAFFYLNRSEFFATLKTLNMQKKPLLIVSTSSDIDSRQLMEWSEGLIVACSSLSENFFKGFYKISDHKYLARQLAGLEIPICCNNFNYFLLDGKNNVQSIVHIFARVSQNIYPIFIEIKVEGQDVFFLAKNRFTKTSSSSGSSCNEFSLLLDEPRMQYKDAILQILPIMMFLRHACNKKCWHNPHHYATLIIDDPWLKEPYGNLSYKRLLKEMQKANFHTTIAFIPWNFDRNQENTVLLFRNNTNKYSISIHGNNHDHYEFYKYIINPKNPWPAKPLIVQQWNIKQALARMEKFRSLTGLSYDKVMIFPHGIAPAKTLGVLKKYNFIATVNADNVPLDSHVPIDLLFQLRPVTTRFENFPSLKRHEPKRSRADIAIDLFLDNPLLFYVHHDFFKDEIGVFNETAEIVNRIQCDIIWQSLGYICQHLYLEKLRDNGQYDVLAFTSNFVLENTHQRDLTYFVQKEESFSFPIKQVTVDERPYLYEKSDKGLLLEIFIPAGESRHVFIEYENDLSISSIDISKNDPRINRLRKLSDFRDLTLSKSVLGRLVISVYYDTCLYKFGIVRLAALTLVLFILIMLGVFYIIKLGKKLKA